MVMWIKLSEELAEYENRSMKISVSTEELMENFPHLAEKARKDSMYRILVTLGAYLISVEKEYSAGSDEDEEEELEGERQDVEQWNEMISEAFKEAALAPARRYASLQWGREQMVKEAEKILDFYDRNKFCDCDYIQEEKAGCIDPITLLAFLYAMFELDPKDKGMRIEHLNPFGWYAEASEYKFWKESDGNPRGAGRLTLEESEEKMELVRGVLEAMPRATDSVLCIEIQSRSGSITKKGQIISYSTARNWLKAYREKQKENGS